MGSELFRVNNIDELKHPFLPGLPFVQITIIYQQEMKQKRRKNFEQNFLLSEQ